MAALARWCVVAFGVALLCAVVAGTVTEDTLVTAARELVREAVVVADEP
jgi:hypothetical protein